MSEVNEALVDAKDEARQAEVRADIAGALLTILSGQRESDRAAFQRTMWSLGAVITALAIATAIILSRLQPAP